MASKKRNERTYIILSNKKILHDVTIHVQSFEHRQINFNTKKKVVRNTYP